MKSGKSKYLVQNESQIQKRESSLMFFFNRRNGIFRLQLTHDASKDVSEDEQDVSEDERTDAYPKNYVTFAHDLIRNNRQIA